MRPAVVIAGCLAAAACAGGGRLAGFEAALAALEATPVDTSTPENAVRSLWAVQDARQAVTCEAVRLSSEPRSIPEARVASALMQPPADDRLHTGHVKEFLQNVRPATGQCDAPPPRYERTIDEVRMESAARAVVHATLRNIMPVPEGAEPPGEWMLEERRTGYRARYVLTNIGGRWLLDEVHGKGAAGDEHEVYRWRGAEYPYYVDPL